MLGVVAFLEKSLCVCNYHSTEIIAVCVSIGTDSGFHSDVCCLCFIALHVFASGFRGRFESSAWGTDECPGCKCLACLIRWLWGGSLPLWSLDLPSGLSCFSFSSHLLAFWGLDGLFP